MTALRKFATACAVTLGLLVLSATPSDARPVLDEPVYMGPGQSVQFAGVHATATGCIR